MPRVHQSGVATEHSRLAASRRAEGVLPTPCPGVGVRVSRLRGVGPSRRVSKGECPGREEEHRIHCRPITAQVLIGTDGLLLLLVRRLLNDHHHPSARFRRGYRLLVHSGEGPLPVFVDRDQDVE